jgi:ABC-type oligopeptide transport system substrate-binding subunit
MRMWKRQLIRFLIFAVLAIGCWLVSCTTSQLASYEKSVDSRSIEGYAKDTNGNPQGGLKYTVHYR